jgi:hypothetical protein
VRGLGGWVLSGLLASTAGAVESPPDPAAERARQVATILGLQALLESSEAAPSTDKSTETLARMRQRVDALLAIERVSLQIDGALARLEREQFAAANARDVLNNHSTRAATNWNIAAVLIGSGTNVIGTGLEFGDQAEIQAGYGVIIGGAALAAAFGIVALAQKSQGRPPYSIETNYLARLLGRSPTPRSELPEAVWRYLDTPLVGEPGSYRSQLVDRFIHEGSLSQVPTAAAQRKIDFLTKPISRGELVPTDVLDTRVNMLDDLRSRVAAMKLDLELLTRHLKASL